MGKEMLWLEGTSLAQDKVVWLDGLNLDYFPVGALAAYGLLRLLEEDGGKVALAFRSAADRPVPGLVGIGEEELVEALEKRLLYKSPLPEELFPYDKVKEIPGWLGEELAKDPKAAPVMRALYHRTESGEILRNPLDTTKGQQGFLKAIRENFFLNPHLDGLREQIRRVLFEDPLLAPGEVLTGGRVTRSGWKHGEVTFPLLGWHPSQWRQAAEMGRSPENIPFSEKSRIHPIATTLAAHALPLYRFLGEGRDLRVRGFLDPFGETPKLLLVLPTFPASWATIRFFLHQATFLETCPRLWPEEVRVWRCERLGSYEQKEPYPVFMGAEPLQLPPCQDGEEVVS